MKPKENSGLLSLFFQLLSKILDFLSKRNSNNEKLKQQMEIEEAKNELKKALAEGRITDAAYWKKKLNHLLSIILLIILSGCTTPIENPVEPVQTVIIGERINKVFPGDKLTIPPLTPPAKQWYLIDDHGLYQWLDITAQP